TFARRALPSNIKMLESLLVSDPQNETLLALLAESYYSYAFGYLELDLAKARAGTASEEHIDELTDRTVDHYMRARNYGFRLLDRPKLKRAATQYDVEKVESLLKDVGKSEIAGLFWAGYGWGSAINLAQQNPDMVAAVPVVEAMMRRVEELDPTYYQSGVHMFFGVSYASRPPMAGGDPAEAKKHFEAAMKNHGKQNLMIPALYGRYYGVQTQNRAFFDRMMKRVLEADLSEHPDNRLMNELAQRRAEFWKGRADELFVDG
ncbi:MAG: TRAP transporter TatT component family protein, partial [Bradymonadaceae bacterium]